MILTRRIYYLIGIPLILLLLSSLIGMFLVWRNNQQISGFIQEFVIKQSLLTNIYQAAGYSGGIHEFSYLIQRRDLAYLSVAREDLKSAITLCENYLSIPELKPVETEAISSLLANLNTYLKNTDTVQNLILSGKSSEYIDRTVQVNDSDAKIALKNLQTYLRKVHEEKMDEFHENQYNIYAAFSAVFFIILVTSLTLTSTVSNRIQKTIETAVSMARAVSSGCYKDDGQEILNDELGSLFSDIRSMANTIHEKIFRLETSNQDLRQFTHIAAHDLREPLNKILVYSDALLVDTSINLEYQKYLGVINRNAETLKNLIKDLLFYADISLSSRGTVTISLQACLDEALQLLQKEISENECKIYSATLPILRNGEEKHFEELFYQLLSNSIKFRSPDRPCKIQVGCTNDVNAITITISDNGVGFSNDYAEKMIQPFSTIKNSKEMTGRGLGLAICNRILQIYKSELKIKGKPNEGSDFSFTIKQI